MVNMKKIYLPIEEFKNVGGPKSFLGNLAKYFDENKILYTNKHDESNGILFPITYKIRELKKYKKDNKFIIQRLDGLPGFPWTNFQAIREIFRKHKSENEWIGIKKSIKFILEMILINRIYHNYSDYIIFQSEYCKKLAFSLLGELKPGKYSVIHNGVHNDIFYPDYNKKIGEKFIFVTSGRFRRNDMLIPIIEALSELDESIGFKLKIVGPIENKNLRNRILPLDFVELYPETNHIKLSEILRSSDAYLFCSLNAPCPNALLEAVSTGLPVVSFDYGAVKELLFFNEDLISNVTDSINPLIKSSENLDIYSFKENIEKLLKNYWLYRKKALEHASFYSFEKCGAKYLEIINRVKMDKI